jgi:hypothetical protein
MLNERIRKLRLAKGMTLQQLGDFFGISRGSVSSWESGVNIPDSRKLEKLADVLGTSVGYLLSGKTQLNQDGDFISKVAFIEWSQIDRDLPNTDLVKEKVLALHRPLGPKSFSSRYPGPTKLAAPYPPIPPGALIFIDPDRSPVTSTVVLLKRTNKDLWISQVSSSNDKKDYLLINNECSILESINSKEIIVLGVITEWRISYAI